MTDRTPAPPRSAEAFHIRHRNMFVALFLLIPALMLPSFLVYKLGRSSLLQRWYTLHVFYERNTGLNRQSAVTFAGTKIGEVRSVELDSSGQIAVNFRIMQDHAHLIRKDSRARLKQKSLVVGDWEIELSRGADSAAAVQEGDTLLPGALVNTDEVLGQVVATVDAIQTIVAGVGRGEGTVGRLLTDDGVYRELEGVGTDARELLRDIARKTAVIDSTLLVVQHLGTSGSALMDSLGRTVALSQQLVRGVDSLVVSTRELPSDLQGTLATVNRDLDEMNTLLRALQRHWLIRGQVKKVVKEKEQAGQ